jgi:RNA-binding protein YlmH
MQKRDNTDTKLLISKAQDAAERALRTGTACFLPFLSDAEQFFVEKNVRISHDDERLIFFGGYEDSEYKCAGFFPSYLFYDESFSATDEFPVKTILAKGSGFRKLTHRDFLGSLMALGVKREVIGDIVVSDDGFSAYIFCLEKTAEYLVSSFVCAANDKISCSVCEKENIVIPPRKFSVINATVNSPRIDALLCACLDVSREEAGKMISAGLVSANHIVCTDKSKICDEGCIISVRHHGRFLLFATGDRNRRDRLRITIHRFI